MTKKLSDEDRHAIDLLLDRDMQDGNAFSAPNSPSPKRIQSVEKILSLLHQMPAQDPPKDLASRTLHRVDQALAALTPNSNAIAPDSNTQRPTI